MLARIVSRLVPLAALALLGSVSLDLGAQEKAAPDSKADHAHATAPAAHDDGAHGAHAHDPTDLVHGNATSELESPAEFKSDMAIFSFVIFLLLLAILAKFAWGPISSGLDKRERGIEQKIEEAHRAAQTAAERLKEYESRLAIASEEAGKIVGQARKDAEVAKEKIMAEAQQAAQRERDRAVADITSAKNQALQEIAEKSVATAVALAGNIIRREVKPEDHKQLITDALNQFPNLN